MTTRKLVVVGASAVALNVVDLAQVLGWKIEVLVDETRKAGSKFHPLNVPIDDSLEPWIHRDSLDIVIAIGDNFRREQVVDRLRERVSLERFASLVHPSASVSNFSHVGTGSIVMAGCRIGAMATIGEFGYLNANTVVAHDCVVGDFVSMSAGAVLGGGVRIGSRTVLGLNSSVRERALVGQDVIIGANSFVNSDVLSNTVVGGVPGRVLKTRKGGDRYLR